MARFAACALALLGATAAEGAGFRDHVVFTASGRLRAEGVDYFTPPVGIARQGAERYGFLGHQLRLGLRATWAHWQLALEGQDTRLLGLPAAASLPAPLGNLGPGAVYYAHAQERSPGATFLKQARATFRHSGFAASVGRFEMSDGLETLPGDPSLAWLKRARLMERLVGPFGYTHSARSFDGVRASYDDTRLNVTGFWSRPTRGGYELRAGGEVDGVSLGGASVTWKPAGPADVRAFYIGYRDNRSRTPVDNRPLAVRVGDAGPIRVETVGGHAAVAAPTGSGTVDLLAWGVAQRGDWGRQSHNAWAIAAEGGYQLPQLPLSPWLRLGINQGSGDRNPMDNQHETFFPLIPTPRIHAQFPFYNAMNNRDVFAQLILRLGTRTTVRADFHDLALTQVSDLWYSGGGVTNEQFFGYSGIPSGARRGLARVVEVALARKLHEKLDAYLYFANASGGAVVRQTFRGERARYGYLELSYRY